MPTSERPISAQMGESLAATLAKVPAGARHGYTGVTLTNTGFQVQGGHRINTHLAGGWFMGKAKGDGWAYGTQLQATW